MFFAKAIGAKIGLGWKIIATRTLKKYQESDTMLTAVRDLYMQMLHQEGLNNYPVSYPLALTENTQARINDLLLSMGLKNKKKNIAVVAGAKRTTNRWPIEYFREVIQNYPDKESNFLLVGSKDDEPLIEPLLALPNVHNFCGKLNPLESAVLLQHCEVTLSNDTGPMHMSYAVGTPVVALFSARDYAHLWYPPLNNHNRVFRSFEETCSPCWLEECPYNNACLRRIKPATIIAELSKRI
jgi:ADP-heptose:LPS heptosyltransferase